MKKTLGILLFIYGIIALLMISSRKPAEANSGIASVKALRQV
jgi:hypothetical protein